MGLTFCHLVLTFTTGGSNRDLVAVQHLGTLKHEYGDKTYLRFEVSCSFQLQMTLNVGDRIDDLIIILCTGTTYSRYSL